MGNIIESSSASTQLSFLEDGDTTYAVASIRSKETAGAVTVKKLSISTQDLKLDGVQSRIESAFAADPYKADQGWFDYISREAKKQNASSIMESYKADGVDASGVPFTTEKDLLLTEALGKDPTTVPKVNYNYDTNLTSEEKISDNQSAAFLSSILGNKSDMTKALEKQYSSNDLSTVISASQPRAAVNPYQDTIGGSDMTVFYLSEMPMFEDVITSPNTPSVWRKELLMFELDSALSLSYSTIRERFPVRAMGNVNPKAYTGGVRTVAGHIAFAVFVDDVLTRLRSQVSNSYKKAMTMALDRNNINMQANGKYNDQIVQDTNLTLRNIERKQELYSMAGIYDGIQLLDSLPPFNLLVMGVNERGSFSKFIIKGVRIVDENQYQGTAYPNITNKVTFVATDLVPMAKFGSDGSSSLEMDGMCGSELRTLSASDLLKDMDSNISYKAENNQAV